MALDLWPDFLPSRETIVVFETPQGCFKLPIGYYEDPWLLDKDRDNKIAALPRYHMDQFLFRFTMPDGTQNKAREYFSAESLSKEGIGRNSGKFLVWFTRAARQASPPYPSNAFRSLSSVAAIDTLQSDSSRSYYDGRTTATLGGRNIGFSLNCKSDPDEVDPLCLGGVYFEQFNLIFQILIQKEHLREMFSTVKMASSLLQAWHCD